MRRCKKGGISLKKKMAVILFIIAIMGIVIAVEFKIHIGPNIDAVSEQKAKGIVTEIINSTIKEQFSGNDYDNFFTVQTGEDGNVQMVQANTAEVNRLISDFAVTLQKKYDDIEPREIKLSYGSLLGSKLLSISDFNVNIKVLPMSVSKCDYETEFESQGINQTKYKIYLVIESNVRILQPFSASNVKIKDRMLISEIVIVGEVPNNYVMVPKDSILDAID